MPEQTAQAVKSEYLLHAVKVKCGRMLSPLKLREQDEVALGAGIKTTPQKGAGVSDGTE